MVQKRNLREVARGAAIVCATLVSFCAVSPGDAADLYVSPFGSSIFPYAGWGTAAHNIQDAIDAAQSGDTVWVTNGTYNAGGKVMDGYLRNIVAVVKPILVQSVNGPAVTTVLGSSSSAPGYARCAWLTNGATLSGFTLSQGTANSTSPNANQALLAGGGVWCASPASTLTNCWIVSCGAWTNGGGAYGGTLNNCWISYNHTYRFGAGACACVLNNCLVVSNWFVTSGLGAGTYGCILTNCTVAYNRASFLNSASAQDHLYNCIVFWNPDGYPDGYNYSPSSSFQYSCSTPLPPGAGNIGDDPQLLDNFHIASTSPCRGAANPLYSFGTDFDGEAWAAPPSMGCDEVWEAAITGPLTVGARAVWPEVAETRSMYLLGSFLGRASRVGWNFGDGSAITNASYLNLFHSWTNPGDYAVTFTAYNADHPTGVSTNFAVHVVPLLPPAIAFGGFTSNGFSLSFPAVPGPGYVVEQTTNLSPPVTWRTVTTLYANGSTNRLYVTDGAATNAARFYRVRTQ